MPDRTTKPEKAPRCSPFCLKAAGTVFAVALSLAIGIYITMALSEKNLAWQSALPKPGMSEADASDALTRAKYLHEAEVRPQLIRAGFLERGDVEMSHRNRSIGARTLSLELTQMLWDMRAFPEQHDFFLQQLTDTKRFPRERLAVLHAMKAFLADPDNTALPRASLPGGRAAANKGDGKTLSDEVAERVRTKALFFAEIVPQLRRAVSAVYPSAEKRGRAAENAAEDLWRLRSAPETKKVLLDALRSAETPEHVVSAIKEFRELARVTFSLSKTMAAREDGSKTGEDPRAGANTLEAKYIALLGREKRCAEIMGKAADIALALHQANVPPHTAEMYLEPLIQLERSPEVLRAAALLLKNEGMPHRRVLFLLEKLAASPEEAVADIANLEELNKANERFIFAMNVEGSKDIIKLPLADIAPKAAEDLAKSKLLALSSSSAGTGKLLRTRHLEKIPQNDQKGENEHLALLEPGERLYVLGDRGNPILAGTPLDIVAASGPALMEYGRDTASSFTLFSGKAAAGTFRPVYYIAAACGPEELRAHLASLMVVRSEREKSLYGPFKDFLWKKEDAPCMAVHPDAITYDVPGTALRLADIRDPDFFLALAPLADKAGLARLMGPIRGIWVQNRPEDKTPWMEVRYVPEYKPEISVLGESPLLELNKAALENIIASKRSFVEYAWAVFDVREETGTKNGQQEPGFAAKLPGALQNMTARFNALAAKGFVSPWDMGAAEYCIRGAGNDARLLEALRAMRDDVSQPSAKRVRAMHAALGK